MRRKGCIFCVCVLFFAGLAAAWAQEEGVILRYKYKPGQEVIYQAKQIQIIEMRRGEETRTQEARTEGQARDFVLSVSDEGIVEMAFYQDQKMTLLKMEGQERPPVDEVWAGLFWQKFNKRGQAVVEKEGRFKDYFEQTEIIELPEGPIDVGATWNTGTKEDYSTYEVLARETIAQNECFQIKGIRHMTPAEGAPSAELEMLFWFAIDKGYVVKFRGTMTGEFSVPQQEMTLSQKSILMGTLLEENSVDEAGIASRLSQLEKLYTIYDAIEAEDLDQAESEINAFTTVFPDSPYKEVAANQARQLETARQMAAAPVSLVGQPAPAFKLPDFEGNSVSLADFKGKVVFLDFWATWCGPCVSAMPHIQALYEKYKDKGLVVIGMNLDSDQEAAKKFAKEKGFTYRHLFAGEIGDDYPLRGIPTFFIIDREAVVRYQESGFAPGLEKEWEKEIEELLAAQGGE